MADDHRNPYAQLDDSAQPLPPPRVRSGNALGVAGFVTSLIAPCTGFLLSPLAVLLSLVGLRKPPRGLAVAGTIIGVLGSVVLVVAIVLINTPLGQTIFSAGRAAAEIVQYHEQHHSLPDPDEGNALVGQVEDGYGTPLRYERIDEHNYVITSAGADRQFDTAEDVRFDFSVPAGEPEQTGSPAPGG